jgi:glycosyltransferase involved in cell wall biosynthesis
MKLVIWHYDPYPTAPGVYLGSFPARGHEVVWVTPEIGDRPGVCRRREGRVEHVEIVRRTDSSLPRPLAVLVNRLAKLVAFGRKWAVMREEARRGPDALQVRELLTEGFLAWIAARRYGTRFVYQFDYPHAEAQLHELDRAGRKAPLARWSARCQMALRDFLLRRADLVLPISEDMAARLTSRVGLSRSKMQVLPVGISAEDFAWAGQASPLALPGLDPARPVVAYMGNLWPIRRPEFLLAVAAEILRREPRAQFLLIGGSNPLVDRQLAAFPYPERLVRAGRRPRDEVLSLLKHATVALFPLPVDDDPYAIFTTSSPLKVVEYLSAGVPVVSSRVGDAVRLLGGSGGGVCVDNRVEDFAEAVLALLADPERARRMGAAGRAYVGRHRVFDVLAAEVEPAYLRLRPDRAPHVTAARPKSA